MTSNKIPPGTALRHRDLSLSVEDNTSEFSVDEQPPMYVKLMNLLESRKSSNNNSLDVPPIPGVDPSVIHMPARRNSVDSLNTRGNITRRKSRSVASRITVMSPTAPVYGADWNLKEQPRGTIGFIHWHEEKGGNGVAVSEFQPGLGAARRQPIYRKRRCRFRPDARAEEAEFVLPKHRLLGQWTATAICGNDITSSVIYTAGLVAGTAGYYTPICLFLVVCLLHFFRAIYAEVVTALPLNGGTYTAILNTTRKGVAIIAACMSFLSYAATVVISAVSAMEYMQGIWPSLNVVIGAIVVILLFACLMLIGIRESAIVALLIFVFHLICLVGLIGLSIAYAVRDQGQNLLNHFQMPGPANPPAAIAIGFSTAMLGITGFESSANFVQHQGPGVFSKTLRNMWIIVAVINPLISVLGFAVIPYERFYNVNTTDGQETGPTVSRDVSRALLALMAREMHSFVGGYWLEKVIISDAIIVLCGAVLTGYVGVVGLLRRMVDDDIFPRICAAKLPITGSNYQIILFFCGVCVTLILITFGKLESISGVYTVSFLSVMFLFCVSNLVLKHTRRELKREVKAKWYIVLLSMTALILALVGNCIALPIIIGYAAIYITIFMSLFYCMFARTFLIRCFLNLTERMQRQPKFLQRFRNSVIHLLLSIEQVPVVFFSRRLNIREMNLAVQRVIADELTRRLTVVHFYDSVQNLPDNINYNVRVLDVDIYPNIRIDVVLIKGKFGPGAVRLTECILEVPPNRMFIASPSGDFPYDVAQLGSVRIIMSRREAGVGAAPGGSESDMQILNGNGNSNGVEPFTLRRCASLSYRDEYTPQKPVLPVLPGPIPGPLSASSNPSSLCSRSSSVRVLIE